MSSLKTYELLTVKSGTLNEGPHPLALGYRKTYTVPFSFHSSDTFSPFLRKDWLYSAWAAPSSEMTQAAGLFALLASTELERDLSEPGSQLLRIRPLEGLWLSFLERGRGLPASR